jgi:hypothetical protein
MARAAGRLAHADARFASGEANRDVSAYLRVVFAIA